MKHIEFETIAIRNFFTYGNIPVVVNLKQPGCTLIQGVDLDNVANGQGANGVGKSTILNAMLYLYGNITPDGLSIDDIVNNVNNKNCSVSGTVLVDGVKYTITKYRKSSEKPEKNYIEIFKDDDVTHNLAKGTMAETTKFISDIIGITPDMLSKLILIDVNSTPFFKETGPRQREIMEDIFGLNDLVLQADKLSDKVKATKTAITVAETEYNASHKLYQHHVDQIAQLTRTSTEWVASNSKSIDTAERQLVIASGIDIEEIRATLKHNEEVSSTVRDLSVQVDNISTDIQSRNRVLQHLEPTSIVSEISQCERLMLVNAKKIPIISAEILQLETNMCPACNQVVDADHAKLEISKKQAEIDAIKAEVVRLNTHKRDLESARDEKYALMEVERSAINELAAQLVAAKQQVADVLATKRSISVPNIATNADVEKFSQARLLLETQLETLRNAVNPYTELLDKANADKIDPPSMDVLDALKRRLSHEQFLFKLLTDKKSFIRKHLIDKRLSMLNSRIHSYLTDLGLPHSLTFNSDLSVSISRMGRPIPYGGLSGGQKARVDLAVRLSFRDILQLSSTKIPFLMIDEALDHGLDDVGVQMATSVLHRLSKQQNCGIFVITHKSEIVNRFPQRLIVQYKDGFSSVKSEVVECTPVMN